MIKHYLYIIVGFLFLTICAHAQSIKGKVVDANTGKPIANASIYLNGTSKGTSSDTEGAFTLNTTEKNIPLIVSCVGYQSETVNNYSNRDLHVALKAKPLVLREVVIGGMSREEQLKIFLTEFIGSTNKDCEIENTTDINFTYHKKTLTLEADVSQPLIINNKKLGYKVTYYLSYFKYSPKGVHYEGNYFFAEDTAGLEPRSIKKILKARDDAYFGSRMHFIRSLWANNLKNNNYFISDTSYNSSSTLAAGLRRYGNAYTQDKRIQERDFYNYLVKGFNGEKYIAPTRLLYIKYYRLNSYLELENTKETLIESNGFYGPGVIWSGEMGTQRVNVLLPYEFEPGTQVPAPKADEKVITDIGLKSIILQQDSFKKYHKPEKLYLQTDKPYYTRGDTLRFKAYLLEGDYFTPSMRSGLLYIELDDKESKSAKRIMVPVTQGLAWGDIALSEKELPEGSYTLRAYTNWMRNFGEDYVYKQNIDISPVNTQASLVRAGFKQGADNKIQASLQFTSLNGHIQALKDMQLKVMNGRKNVSTDKISTGVDGTVSINFNIPEKANINDLTIKAQDITKGVVNAPELVIPITVNRPENTDLQFMPEGGNLVAGIKTRVGFKALNEDGRGAAITGSILDSKLKEIVRIRTTHAGMGSFEFTPKEGETYTASLYGINKTYQLPAVNAIGTAISIQTNKLAPDSLTIIVAQTAPLTGEAATAAPHKYYLVGQSRGVICYAQVITFINKQPVKMSAAKDLFPTGVARFTLFNNDRQPLNERVVFINLDDNLNVSITPDKPKYTTRDSVNLSITVTDKDGRPVQGDFSLAVTDDDQVRQDSLKGNIISNLLLTSDLKGTVEDQNYYFNSGNKSKDKETRETDLDNLMLTQGWVGYAWKDVFSPTRPKYKPELEYVVEGKVTNAFNKPVDKSGVTLLLNKPFTVLDTVTDSLGRFVFKDLFPLDSAVINLQARNKKGKEFNVGVEVEEFKAPEFKAILPTAPWYVNSDSLLLKNNKTKAAQLQAIADYNGEGRLLKEVVIKDKHAIKDSKNLNGPGEADEILDEDFMHKANHQTLFELLTDKYKNFFQREFWPGGRSVYHLKNHWVHLVIDGVFIERYGLRVEDYMDYLTAEDIKGIEIMNSAKFASAYNINYIDILTHLPERYLPIYLEITTYSGNGAFYKKTPGIYVYRPIPFTLPKEFYRPRYTLKNNTIAMGTDLRSTLHWEPNVVTNADGKATVSFYTADKPSDYSVIVEGSNLDGQLGYGKQKIKLIMPK